MQRAPAKLDDLTRQPASMQVAEKLGFALQRSDFLYAIGVPIPAPARRE